MTAAQLRDFAVRVGRTFAAAALVSLVASVSTVIDLPTLKAAGLAAAIAGVNAVVLLAQHYFPTEGSPLTGAK